MTRTGLLYQGVICVLVIMFMPAGLFSIGKWWSSNRGRFSVARLSGVLSGWVVGCAVAAAGFVFLCEFLALILALDYQSKLTDGAAWPGDRKSVVEGKSVSVRVDLGGRRFIKKKKNKK